MPQGNRRAGQRNRRDTKKTNKSESQHPLEVKGHQTRRSPGCGRADPQHLLSEASVKKRCGGETVSEQTVLCYATVRSAFVFMAMQS